MAAWCGGRGCHLTLTPTGTRQVPASRAFSRTVPMDDSISSSADDAVGGPRGSTVPGTVARAAAAQAFYDLAALAALTVDVPMALISMVEDGQERFQAWVGFDDLPVSPSILRLAARDPLAASEMLVVSDTHTDPRFTDYLALAATQRVRFYLEAPICAATGERAGTLVLLGPDPRTPDARQLALVRGILNRIVAEVDRARLEPLRPGDESALEQERRALRDSAAVYRMLVEQSGDGIFVVDGSSLRIVEVNESAVALTGYSRSELLQLRTSDLVMAEDVPILMNAISSIQAGKRVIATRRLRRKDGSLFWCEVITKALPDGRRQSLVRNVSERIRMEEERAALLERVTDAFIALDADGRFTWVNEKAAQTFGRRAEDMLGRSLWLDFGATLSQRLKAACEEVMRTQIPVTIEDFYEPHGRWYEDRIFPSATGLSIFFSDITERKKAEAELNLSEARFRVLVEEGADVVVMLTAEGVFTWVSPSVTRVLGWATSDMVGSTAVDFLHPDDRDATADVFVSAMQQPGYTGFAEFGVRHKDGSYRTIRGFGVNRFDDPVFGAFVGSWHDITEQREAERVLVSSADSLRRLTQRLQAVREEEQAHLSRELHDQLGQSMTMLKLGLSRVMTLITNGDAAALDKAKQVSADVDGLIDMTRRISADLRPPMLDDFGLASALEWAGQRFATRTGIECRTTLEECAVSTDAARALYAIAQESLTNIVRHAQATVVTITLGTGADGVRLEVTDNGVGIARAPTREGGGLGMLGMRERAAAIGAALTVSPADGGGTAIAAVLPAPVAA